MATMMHGMFHQAPFRFGKIRNQRWNINLFAFFGRYISSPLLLLLLLPSRDLSLSECVFYVFLNSGWKVYRKLKPLK